MVLTIWPNVFLFGWSNKVPKRGYQLLNTKHVRIWIWHKLVLFAWIFSRPLRRWIQYSARWHDTARPSAFTTARDHDPKDSRDADTDTIPTPSSRPIISCPSPTVFSFPLLSLPLNSFSALEFGAAHSIASVPSPSLFPPLPGSIMDQEST
jgi:hypothetical protein